MPSESDTIQPITREVAVSLAHPPEGVERSLWLYELCRFLTMKVNNLIIAFFAENPPCSAESCPEMRASEWQYLCAVHDPPKPCCAIDYCCHTIDWATNILTSPKYFPSRLTLGSDAAGGPQASMRYLTNIFRRLYRIFAHAWFQHRDVFRQVENTDGLYVFFKTVCDVYELIPHDNYTIPGEAEQSDGDGDNKNDIPASSAPPSAVLPGDNRRISVLRKDHNGVSHPHFAIDLGDPQTPSNISSAATTRRHKHSPSTGSSVTTITEALEESSEMAAKEPSLFKVEENKEAESKPAADGEVVAEETKKETAQDEVPSEKVEDAESIPKTEEPEEKATQLEAEAPNTSSSTDSELGEPGGSEQTETEEKAEEKAEAEVPAEEETSKPETVEDAPADTPTEPEAPPAADQEPVEPSPDSTETSTKISVEEKPAEDDE